MLKRWNSEIALSQAVGAHSAGGAVYVDMGRLC